MPTNLYLFSTTHCHLCETAIALILQLPNAPKLNVIEIANNEQLLARYGLTIPVLQRQDTLAELYWPFNTAEIAKFIE